MTRDGHSGDNKASLGASRSMSGASSLGFILIAFLAKSVIPIKLFMGV